MSSVGNHEYDHVAGGEKDPSGAPENGFRPVWGNYGNDSGGECAVPMFHRWHVPSNGHGIFWYSFNYGNIHVVQLSSEHNWTRNSKQYQWLENDLLSVNRTETPWIILTAHRMMYTTQLAEEADLKISYHFREEVEDLLWKHQVNLMLVGHQHSYERSCPVYRGKCRNDGKGTVHVVVGSAGAALETSGFSKNIGNWSLVHGNIYGYLKAISDNHSMKLQFIENKNGEVFDRLEIRRWSEH